MLTLGSAASKWMRNRMYQWLRDRQEARKQRKLLTNPTADVPVVRAMDIKFLETFDRQALSQEKTRTQLIDLRQDAEDFEAELEKDEELF